MSKIVGNTPSSIDAASMDDGVLPTIFAFEEPQQLLSPWVVTCFTINVIMGSGFLGVPHGFREAGIVLGPLVLLGVTVLQWTAACQLAQVITRANALLADADAAATLTPTLAPLAKSEAESVAKLRPSPPSLNVPSHTSYEMLMLCRLHLGAWAERLVMLSAALYMVGTLCARLRDEPPPRKPSRRISSRTGAISGICARSRMISCLVTTISPPCGAAGVAAGQSARLRKRARIRRKMVSRVGSQGPL